MKPFAEISYNQVLVCSGIATALQTFDGTPVGITIGIFLLLVAGGFCSAAFIDFLLLAKVTATLSLYSI